MATCTLLLGGTGAIGSIVGASLWHDSQAEVHLIGRTGRSQNKGFEDSTGCVSLHRCDASGSDECSALMEDVRHKALQTPGASKVYSILVFGRLCRKFRHSGFSGSSRKVPLFDQN